MGVSEIPSFSYIVSVQLKSSILFPLQADLSSNSSISIDSSMDTLSLAIVQYIFTSGEHEVKIAPHGNSKGGESYVRTMPSVLTKLKSTAAEKTVKRALAFVAQEAGGIKSAHSASALPHERQQVDDIRRASLSNVDTDPLCAMMVMCKESEGKNAPEVFVRMVNAAPFPMMVLAFDWTLGCLGV